MSNHWNESELRLATLQVLKVARKRKVFAGEVPKDLLMVTLNVQTDQLEPALDWLMDNHLIREERSGFGITADGVDYLDVVFPPDLPDSSSDPPPSDPPPERPPWSAGDPPGRPPRRGPDDPSRVPLRQRPSGGAGEIALPLPDPRKL